MATTSRSHKYNQLKWMYSALSGLCVAFFLALFSNSFPVANSVFLQLSTMLFAVCLPTFATFSIAHVYMIELDVNIKDCDEILEQYWIKRVTKGAFACLGLAFLFLVGHFSISAMLAFIVVSLLWVRLFGEFVRKLQVKVNQTN